MMYRGGVGQWSWLLHRVTGVGVLVFLCLHILDTAMIMWGPAAYNHMVQLYRNPFFRPMEVGLLAAVLFHALNGLRVIVVDVWSQGSRHQKTLFYGVLIIFWPVFLYGAYHMLRPLWQ